MLDINLLRKDLAHVVARLEARKAPQPFLDVPRFSTLEAERKTLQTRTEELQAQRNALSKQIGQAKGKGEDTAALMAEARDVFVRCGSAGRVVDCDVATVDTLQRAGRADEAVALLRQHFERTARIIRDDPGLFGAG